MRKQVFCSLAVLLAAVFFSYTSANAQIVEKTKEAAGKVKDVTVDTTKKTAVFVTDGLEKAADKTKDVTVDTTKSAASSTRKFGNHAVSVTENVVGQSYEGGKWFTVTTWDGTKWVSKKTWFATKKAADATKDAVTN